MCTGLWIGSAYLPGLWAARHAMPSPWEQVQGLLLSSGADFEARRSSTNGVDLRALEVFGEWSTSAEAVAQDPGEGLLRRSLIAYRPAMRLARVAKKKQAGRPSLSQPFESIGNDGGR